MGTITGRMGVGWTRHCPDVAHPSNERVMLRGYHIWWCQRHRQPSAWCEIGRLQDELDEALKRNSAEGRGA